MARLYLLTPALSGADLDGFRPRFDAALAAGDVASVLLRFAPGADPRRVFAQLMEIASPRDVALLIEGDVRLAARLGADGAHVGGGDVAEAVASFKSERIVGAGALRLRDDAMSAAEAGADYVMFGEPDGAGHVPALASTLERVSWWAEVFEIPCVSYAPRVEDAAALAAAGADFVALGEAAWDAEAIGAAMKGLP